MEDKFELWFIDYSKYWSDSTLFDVRETIDVIKAAFLAGRNAGIDEAKVRDMEVKAKNIIHCDSCGASWYDDGFTASCPLCRISKLEAENERLKEASGKYLSKKNDDYERLWNEVVELQAKLSRYEQGVEVEGDYISWENCIANVRLTDADRKMFKGQRVICNVRRVEG